MFLRELLLLFKVARRLGRLIVITVGEIRPRVCLRWLACSSLWYLEPPIEFVRIQFSIPLRHTWISHIYPARKGLVSRCPRTDTAGVSTAAAPTIV